MSRYRLNLSPTWRKSHILDIILLISAFIAIVGSIFMSVLNLWWFHISVLTPYLLNLLLFFCGLIAIKNYRKEIEL